MGLTDQIKKTALKTAFSYLEKNPEENAPKLMAWVDKLAGNGPDTPIILPIKSKSKKNQLNLRPKP